jgi:pimeloyl-ACP methyl ester carboxylesterase
MLAWHDDFCRQLADRRFHVVRFDNRDVGRSTHFTEHRAPTPIQLLRRDPRGAAYALEDMADDAAGLLTALGAENAHIVGASMGGMIAQLVAIRHPQRTLSLASIMSTTGHRLKGQPALRIYPYFLANPPKTRDQAIERVTRLYRAIGSPGFDWDEDELRELAGRSFDRATGDAFGTGRQLAAIMCARNRTPDLGRIDAPTLVVHGTKDRLVRPSGGRATARAISGSRLLMIAGMGHDMPRGTWPRMIEAMVDNAGRAEPPAAKAA